MIPTLSRNTAHTFIKESLHRVTKAGSIDILKPLSNDTSLESYLVGVKKNYFHVTISAKENRIKTKINLLQLLKKKQLPIPEIIDSNMIINDDTIFYTCVEKVAGRPFFLEKLHIYDHNRVLANFAKTLLEIHRIQLLLYGFLKPNLNSNYPDWNMFISSEIEGKIEELQKNKIFTLSVYRSLKTMVYKKNKHTHPILLHGQLSGKSLYIDSDFEITAITDITLPLSGDPHYDLAGFMLHEGFERAQRLIKTYYLLGGLVEWNSETLIRHVLIRYVRFLFWAVQQENKKHVSQMQGNIIQLVKTGMLE